MNTEQPVKLGLIAVGVISFVAAMIYNTAKGPNAAMMTGPAGGSIDFVTIISSLISVVTLVMAALGDIKKLFPPEMLAEIEHLVQTRDFSVNQIMALITGKYGRVDMKALYDIIRSTFNKLKIKPKGDDTVDPIVDDGKTKPVMTEDERTERIKVLSTGYTSWPIKLDLSVGGKGALYLEMKKGSEQAAIV